MEFAVGKLTQVFRNNTDKPIIIMLEPHTSRYRLAPGEELLLRYEPKKDEYAPHGAPIVMEFEDYRGGVGMVMHTREDEMLGPDGHPSRMTSE